MESVKRFENYLIDHNHRVFESSDILSLMIPKMDYREALNLQQLARDFVQQSSKKVFIHCSHPLVVTMGRGDRQNQHLLNESNIDKSLDVVQIKRGGGATLHYPEQWIFYPIMKLHPEKWNLITHISWLLKMAKYGLAHYGLEDTKALRNPLGLWHGMSKIASVGVGVDRFITQHGIALNLASPKIDQHIFEKLSPCGLSSNTYTSLYKETNNEVSFADFAQFQLKNQENFTVDPTDLV